MQEIKKWQTLLFHDTFLMKGGAERMNIEIAKILESDIATAYWSENCYDARQMGFSWEIFQVNPTFRKWMLGFLKMKWSFYRSSRLVRDYDTVFFSNEAITAIHEVRPGTKTYYYAHSISRHLFDLSDDYLQKVPLFAKAPYRIVAYFLKKLYISELQKVDVIFVNSHTNKNRIKEWIGRDDAIILYPPVDTERFQVLQNDRMTEWQKRWVESGFRSPLWGRPKEVQGLGRGGFNLSNISSLKWQGNLPTEYYLSFARLTHAKRVDQIIRAFQWMPEKQLVVLYWREDSQQEVFRKMGEWYENIHFLTLSDNTILPKIIAWALATIAVSQAEDFGMVAIESLACGVPVIAVDEWGYQEILTHDRDSFLIPGDFLDEDLRWAVQKMTPERSQSMSRECRARAEDFSIERMRRELEGVMRL